MNDPKNNQKDIVAVEADDSPDMIADEALEDVEGGLSLNFTRTKFRAVNNISVTGSNLDTIYAGIGNDTINADFGSIINPDSMLKR